MRSTNDELRGAGVGLDRYPIDATGVTAWAARARRYLHVLVAPTVISRCPSPYPSPRIQVSPSPMFFVGERGPNKVNLGIATRG